MMRIIGITGKIGSGKSEIARYLETKGAYLIDADAIGHQLLAAGNPVFDAIVNKFGKEILGKDGNIDRKTLGNLIFNDWVKRWSLNKLMHLPMKEMIVTEIEKARKQNYKVVVLEAAILRSSPWISLVTEVWVVNCSKDICLERLELKGLNIAEAEKRWKAQSQQRKIPLNIPLKIITNNGLLTDTLKIVDNLWSGENA